MIGQIRQQGLLVAAVLAVQGCAAQLPDEQPARIATLQAPEEPIETGFEWDEFAPGELTIPSESSSEPLIGVYPYSSATYPVRVRLSERLTDTQRILGEAALEEIPGVITHSIASYELAPHPQFPDHLVFHAIKGPSDAKPAHFRVQGAMTLEEIYDYYADEYDFEYAWATNVPVPVELGRADRPEFANDLRRELIPITQSAGLESLSRYTNPEWLTLCLSEQPVIANLCPQMPGRSRNAVSNAAPLYLSVTNHEGDRKFITVVSVAPSGQHTVLLQQWSGPGYSPVPIGAEQEPRSTGAGAPEDQRYVARPYPDESQAGTIYVAEPLEEMPPPSKIYRIGGDPPESPQVQGEDVYEVVPAAQDPYTAPADPYPEPAPIIGEMDPNAPAEEPYTPRLARTYASTPGAGYFFAEPGEHKVYIIATEGEIDPAIFDLQFGDPVPSDICNKMTLGPCLARTGADPQELTRRVIDIKGYSVMSLGEFPTTDRVVSGDPADRADALWQAQLFVYREGDPFFRSTDSPRVNFEKMHKCGGSYIGGGYIVTAAHCIRDDITEMRIRLGTNDMVRGGKTFRVHSVVIHRRGNADYSRRADIAVIKVHDPHNDIRGLSRKGHLAAIALAPNGFPQTGMGELLATGWGYLSAMAAGTRGPLAADGSFQRNPSYLQGLELVAIDPTRCTGMAAFRRFEASDIICARGAKAGSDTCKGDSGGPVTVQSGRRRILVGIVSSGVGCAQSNLPSVYVNVAQYGNWILRARRELARAPRGRVILLD